MGLLRDLFVLSGIDDALLKKRIFGAVFLLSFLGLVMVFSSSFAYADASFGSPFYFLIRQAIFLLVGYIAMFIGYKIPPDVLRRNSKLILLLSIVGLILVLIPGVGHQIGGARRWLSLGPFHFQPSELAQLAIIIYVADLFARRVEATRSMLSDITHMIPAFIVFGLIAGLVLLEPDMGTTIVTAMVLGIIMLVVGLRFSYLLSLLVISLPLAWFLIFSVSYRRARILSFLNPWADPLNRGFQIIQAQIALGSGGVFGRGLGHGLQKLFYLPAAHTDFIFAVIGEEFGILGTLFVVFVFFYLFVQGFLAAIRQKDLFRKLFITGLMGLLFLETIINLGVNVGLLPPKGLPLPFVSYGGTSCVINLFSIGILLRML